MTPRTIRIDGKEPAREPVAEAARLLRDGGLVVLPTETVYGLAFARDREAAAARARALKGRPGDKPFTVHLADPDDLRRHIPEPPERARPLAARFWPGPLTLVLPAPGGGTQGFRVPALRAARDVIREAGVPVVATSVNFSGEPDATSADDIPAGIAAGVDLILDSGPTLLREPSTIVRVATDGQFEVLREGIITREMVARQMSRLVLFVCTGNTCRSPMAAALFRRKLAARLGVAPERLEDQGWLVLSAGTAASNGSPASSGAVTVMREDGIDLLRHRSQALRADLVEDAILVVAMGSSHRRQILDWWPEHASKVVILDPDGIPDPVGGPIDLYRECRDRMAPRIDLLLGERFGGAGEGFFARDVAPAGTAGAPAAPPPAPAPAPPTPPGGGAAPDAPPAPVRATEP